MRKLFFKIEINEKQGLRTLKAKGKEFRMKDPLQIAKEKMEKIYVRCQRPLYLYKNFHIFD